MQCMCVIFLLILINSVAVLGGVEEFWLPLHFLGARTKQIRGKTKNPREPQIVDVFFKNEILLQIGSSCSVILMLILEFIRHNNYQKGQVEQYCLLQSRVNSLERQDQEAAPLETQSSHN
eukprot:TRINITY_DN12624_c0_g1_i1.p1 TRINITY_DN12624_c0_g1~~TRINITY_DN12624_c0_g1_i1.p1  ORF type:complete len:120 (+),score=3.95 TRINITY_DN12624_c0_g1_i1:458-817(+)